MKNGPENDSLERAYLAVCAGNEPVTGLLRQVFRHDVYFIMPADAEIPEGSVLVASGRLPPPMAVWGIGGIPYVPVFTTLERATRALEQTPGGTERMVVSLDGEELFGLLAQGGHAAVINALSPEGQVRLSADLVKRAVSAGALGIPANLPGRTA